MNTISQPLKNQSVKWLVAIGIVTITFVVFYPSVDAGFTNWDDPVYVTESALITDLSANTLYKFLTTDVSLNYHPFTMISLAMDYKLYELEPSGYHWTNLIFHLLNTALVFWFIWLLTGGKIIIASIVSLVFGVHPMHVESVTWIAERKDVLYAFFFLLSSGFYVKYVREGSPKWIVLVFIFFLCSMMAKAVAVVLPVVFILLDLFLGRKINSKMFAEKIPFLFVSTLFGIHAISIQAKGAMAAIEVFTLLDRIMFASYGFIMYLIKFVVPLNLSAFYPYPNLSDDGSLPLIFYISPLIVMAILAVSILMYRRISSIFFSALFYLITIALVLQFISVGRAIIADRYTYIPYIGVAFLLGFGLDQLLNSKKLRILGYGLATAIVGFIGFLSFTTYERIKVWENSETLWTDVINKYPQVAVAYKNRGNYYGQRNETEKALKDYKVLVAMNSIDSKVYSNLGNIYGLRKEFDASLSAYSKAISLNSTNYEAYVNRGITYSMMKEYSKAINDYDQALKLRPRSENLLMNRAYTYFAMGDYDASIKDYDQAEKKGVRTDVLYFYRGLAYFNLSYFNKAIVDFEKSLQINPSKSEAIFNISVTYYQMGEMEKAREFVKKAMKVGYQPDQTYLNQLGI
ncbi:MAG: tetratricopeptide repeat protein [Bacteroidetes bacterium]|nr:tetratricopeptide repeat protein [Bacteroidota bacterium]